MRFWCCSIISSVLFYLFLSSSTSFFFLNPNGSYFCSSWVNLWRLVYIQGVRICGSSQVVSELMVKRQPWFCWVLLVRDRVSSTLEWVECNNSYESVFVSEYIKLFYIVMIGLLSGIWILVGIVCTTLSIGISKHLFRTIRHDIVLNWVNEIILPWVYFYI